MRRLLQVTALIGCPLFLATAFGQTIPPRQNPRLPPPPRIEDRDVVRVSTNLVQVDATVLDKNGKIVTGLTADDFEIYENNKKQQITNFSFVELQPDKSTAAAITVKSSKNASTVPPMPTTLRREQVRRTIALVVDDLGLSFGSIDAVRSALKKFVDEQMQPGDLVAIIRTSSGVGVLQQFTSDKRVLYAAIKHVRWSLNGRGGIGVFQAADPSDFGATGSSTVTPNLPTPPETIKLLNQSSAETLGAEKQFGEFREDIFAVGTLGAINYVVKGIRELPGRKAVVLFSDGFGLYDLDKGIKKPNPRLINSFQRLTELANRSSVIIYTMDARGIVNPIFVGADDSFENFIWQGTRVVNELQVDRSTALYETQQGLRALAELTGGFAMINNNNLGKGLERVLNDQKGYYLIGYRPDSETFDPKQARFHKLTVKLKRPELHVRYRSGFFGIKDEEIKPAPVTPRQQIVAALTSPFNSGDIDLRLTSLFVSDATGASMRSLVYVDGDALKFTEAGDDWQKATFEIVSMIFGDNGTIVDEVSRTETVKAKADTLREMREKGFVATIMFPIKKPGGYQIRVVMRDTATSRIGSASQYIEVPNLKKKQLALSGIVMERHAAKSTGTSSKKPFQTDAERDAATRRFHPGDTLRFDLSIYNAKTDKTTKPGLVTYYKVYRDGKQIFVAPEKAINLSQEENLWSIDTSGVFDLGKKIPPGDYVLQVIVKDLLAGEKGQVATQWTDFEIIP